MSFDYERATRSIGFDFDEFKNLSQNQSTRIPALEKFIKAYYDAFNNPPEDENYTIFDDEIHFKLRFWSSYLRKIMILYWSQGGQMTTELKMTNFLNELPTDKRRWLMGEIKDKGNHAREDLINNQTSPDIENAIGPYLMRRAIQYVL
jgi:hypothetical protein